MIVVQQILAGPGLQWKQVHASSWLNDEPTSIFINKIWAELETPTFLQMFQSKLCGGTRRKCRLINLQFKDTFLWIIFIITHWNYVKFAKCNLKDWLHHSVFLFSTYNHLKYFTNNSYVSLWIICIQYYH